MAVDMSRHKDTFKEEAYELLAELETSLLELEENPGDTDVIGRVFRAMHTIKGSGAMFGFDNISSFTHEVETVFDLVRNGKVKVTKPLIDLTLSARDHILTVLDAGDVVSAEGQTRAAGIIAALRSMAPAKEEQGSAAQAGTPTAAASAAGSGPKGPEQLITYRIVFRPPSDILEKGTNPLYLLDDLRQMGDCRIVAHTTAVPQLTEICSEACYTNWDIILTTGKGVDAIRDVFIFVADEAQVTIDVIDDGGMLDNEAGYKKLGEILIEKGDLKPEDLRRILDEQKKLGEMLVDAGVVDPDRVAAALAEQEHIKEVREKRQVSEPGGSSVRVPSEKLDILVDLVGEMVTIQSLLSQAAAEEENPRFQLIAEEVERLTVELRNNTMSIRMLPIGSTFSKLKRLVRDLSRELGKEIELTTEGAETELDKTVIEKLNDPLVHLIRNSIDHGIEYPEGRKAAGKPAQGTVHLSAVHSGAHVLIRIKDDGAGLDPRIIRAKGIEKGLISAEAELTERELFALILAPGFSTAKQVTSVSGRGVGMDVVKRSIDALRGAIDISSTRGIGTTITLKLPLTLAIIEGLLVKIGEEAFVVPLSVVEECIELTPEDRAHANGRHVSNVRGRIVPYIRLREQFRISGEEQEIEQIVIVEAEGSRIGFVVDKVIGEHQTVIKTLGGIYKDVNGVSGATILGDGTVALILDVPHLVQAATLEEQALCLDGRAV